MQLVFRVGVALAMLLALSSCGAGEGAPSDGTILGSETVTITVWNTSPVGRTIIRQRFYNYDTAQFEPRSRTISPTPPNNFAVFHFPRGGTWNVDVDFEGGTGFHGNSPNPPWVGDVSSGSVSFWRNW